MKPTNKRYVLIGAVPFVMYTGTMSVTSLKILARTNDKTKVKALTDKHFDAAGGLLLWLDCETGKRMVEDAVKAP